MDRRARIPFGRYVAIVTAMAIITLVAVALFTRSGKSESSIKQIDGTVQSDVIGI